MNQHRPRRPFPATAFLAVLALSLLTAACGSLSGDLGPVATPPLAEPSPEGSTSVPTLAPSQDPTTGPTTPGTSPQPTATPEPAGTTTVRVYYFLGSFVDNDGLVPVLREIPKTQAVGAAAMQALLEGPNDNELGARPAMYSVIPDGTRYLGLRIDAGVATVNLSREFASGGGATSVLGRLAQVVYTLTQFPTVSSVRFELDGEPVTVFSGEGVVLDTPVDRADYEYLLPAIFVDRPAWGGVLANPARLVGVANAFEATFHVRILDGEGRSLADGPVMATCGTGCYGTFDVTIPYTVSSPRWGTLQVYELSAKDGSIVNMTEYPVWLTP
ncbi:MAG TPA: Gmad2 immunoglobulin-like domain-containing protein [Candidatus Limnocylindria bacterium]|nr:Gmad2 immunoglobulin-like domain-containing protein [Candidatus Limnocylindria bacterium]